mmetsp:Transcript_8272/g.34071  ORF Transcript_8272/g.34071 Transcript_8272/m.34071 type:complete len:316 (+) Transcript_8272:115-1062(+)
MTRPLLALATVAVLVVVPSPASAAAPSFTATVTLYNVDNTAAAPWCFFYGNNNISNPSIHLMPYVAQVGFGEAVQGERSLIPGNGFMTYLRLAAEDGTCQPDVPHEGTDMIWYPSGTTGDAPSDIIFGLARNQFAQFSSSTGTVAFNAAFDSCAFTVAEDLSLVADGAPSEPYDLPAGSLGCDDLASFTVECDGQTVTATFPDACYPSATATRLVAAKDPVDGTLVAELVQGACEYPCSGDPPPPDSPTNEGSSSKSKKSDNVDEGLVAGAVVGAIVGLGLVVGVAARIRRRRLLRLGRDPDVVSIQESETVAVA